jgi:hypothetical protein
MAVMSGAPKLELRSVAVFDFGFMDFWWFDSEVC